MQFVVDLSSFVRPQQLKLKTPPQMWRRGFFNPPSQYAGQHINDLMAIDYKASYFI